MSKVTSTTLPPDYVRSSIGISKFITLVASTGVLFLSGSTRPTKLQEEIVDSTWKEDGLFYLSIVGILFTLASMIWGILLSKQYNQNGMLIKELPFFAIVCALFLIFGSGTLESALNIFSKVGDCCEDYYHQTNNTCVLPGLIFDEYYDGPSKIKTRDTFLDVGIDIITIPENPECSADMEYNSWRCTICVNELIQPKFKLKGAAGASGLITALANFIVVFVGVRQLRTRKPIVYAFNQN